MAITQAVCTSFKVELFKGKHNFTPSTGHAFKIALYTSASNLSASTLGYGHSTSTFETTGTNYNAGGTALTTTATFPKLVSTTACVDFGDVTWATSTITANGALIYNDTVTADAPTVADAAVVTLWFGSDKSSTAGDFTIVFPAEDASNAIIRIV